MAPSTQAARQAKERFFDKLDHLGQSEDELMSEDEVQVILNSSKSKDVVIVESSPIQRSPLRPDPLPHQVERLTKTSVITLTKGKPVSIGKPDLSARKVPESVSAGQRSIMKPQEASKTSRTKSDAPQPKTGRHKAKAKDEIQYVHEDERIFNGLTFFFIPNNDVTKPRKRRIQAGIARGATWVRNYSEAVTHVVVDIELEYSTVGKAFNDREVPHGANLVKDTWLIDSIKYGYVQNDAASRYKLRGAPVVAAAPAQGEKRPRALNAIDGHESPKPRKRKLVEFQQQETPPTPSPTRSEDEMDRIMQEIQEIPPLSSLETDSVTSLNSSVSESNHEEHNEDHVDQQTLECPKENRGFQCMEKNDGKQENPNSRTIEMLQGMASCYDRTGDQWRTFSYRKGITALRKQKYLVRTKEDALKIPGIGERLADKIEEIVSTDRLRRLENAENDPNDKVLQLFMGIYDVGYKQASKWIAQGHRSLDDLTQNADLTANQKVGIEHYNDFQQRIPRDEVAQHGEIVKLALQSVDPELELIVGGSYRRGNTTSGDIDCLITKKDADMSHIRTLIIGSVIPLLKSQNFLKVALAAGTSRDASKWHGTSCLSGSTTWRRIDLLYVPWESLGAALIYFTGNDIFNRSIRLLASRKGWRLNQHGLYKDVMRGEGRKKVADGTLIEGHSERKIFEVLGVPWRAPWERKC